MSTQRQHLSALVALLNGDIDGHEFRGNQYTKGAAAFSSKQPIDGKVLDGVMFAPWYDVPKTHEQWQHVDGQNNEVAGFEKPIADVLDARTGKMKTKSAGVIVQEKDGRIWVVEPSNHFADTLHTFPKGGIEHGHSPQVTAIKEAYEESGLKVAITGFAGDYERSTSVTRYYFAKRVGGSPSGHGWESQKVKLVPPAHLWRLLNKPVDKFILADVLAHQKQLWPLKNTRACLASISALTNAVPTFHGNQYVKLPGYDEAQERSRLWVDHPVYGKETIGDWLDRHKVERTPQGLYHFVHATPKANKFTTLRVGSLLETDPKAAIHFAGRDRGLKPKDIMVHHVYVKPSEIDGGQWAELIKEVAVHKAALGNSDPNVFESPSAVFQQALKAHTAKVALPTNLTTKEISDTFGKGFFQRGFVSSQVHEAQVLDTLDTGITQILQGKNNPNELRVKIGQVLKQTNYLPPDGKEGTISDLRTLARQNLIINTNLKVARGTGRAIVANDPDVLDQYPAWELVPGGFRRHHRGDPIYKPGTDGSIDWLERWQDALDECSDDPADIEAMQSVFDSTGRMIALKSSSIWQALGDGAGGRSDTLGNPFPPFAWESSYTTIDIARDECEELGLLEPGDTADPLDLGDLDYAQDPAIGSADLLASLLEAIEGVATINPKGLLTLL